MRSAFFLLMIAFGVMMLSGSIGILAPGMPAGVALAVSALATLAGFGLSAWLGLCVADGDQRKIVPMHALSRAQVMYLTMAGVLFVCPASLAADMQLALFARMGMVQSSVATVPAMGLFLPMLIKSVLLAPVCEELFFRGYLMNALRPYSKRTSLLLSSLAFALVHGVDAALLPRFALGCLLGMAMVRTGSVLAPMLVHAAYNFALLVLSFTGLQSVLTGDGLIACAVRVASCAAFVCALRRMVDCRMLRRLVSLQDGAALSRREKALLIGTGIALLAAMIISGVTA